MKKSKCSHKVYRKRGPQEIWVVADGSEFDIAGWTKVVWEVCLKCRSRKRIPFLYEKGQLKIQGEEKCMT